jgi:tRNA(Ile2) C34 agmatinyltransferase TiaS
MKISRLDKIAEANKCTECGATLNNTYYEKCQECRMREEANLPKTAKRALRLKVIAQYEA